MEEVSNPTPTPVAAATQEMAQFFTRQKANEGIIMPLELPDGTPSGHWLRVRGVDSDAFQEADSRGRRRALQIAQIDDEKERDRQAREMRLETLACLVTEWSFPIPLTEENVINLLREAPQIAKGVDVTAYRRGLFFAASSKGSSPTPEAPSSST
jgi:hypothetical protein